jgi:hypothetical protein
MNCAQCHNHPFVKLKRQDYWGMAAFFTQITRRPGFGLIDSLNPQTKAKMPEYAQVVPARFLGGPEAKLDPQALLRPVLAKWVIAPENPFFAQAMVNRMWAHLFGRGIVHPFDDMHEENKPSHPELLHLLTKEFIASGYNVKHLLQAICESEAYQRSSWPATKDKEAGEPQWLAHRQVRVLTPWQLYDSLERLGLTGNKEPVKQRKDFVKFFSTDGEADPFNYERGFPQALRLMNATRLDGLLTQVAGSEKSSAGVIERMYLTVLARRPTAAESARMVAHVERSGSNPRPGYADVLWVLLQSSEFTVNH